MAEKRTRTMELRAIRQQMAESPPPPPAGATVREWFAGLALMNPELMKGLSPTERVAEAARIADELARALLTPKVPSLESMASPTEAEMEKWDTAVAEKREAEERQGRATAPQGLKPKRTQTAAYGSFVPRDALPPPTAASVHFKRASDHLARATRTGVPAFNPNAGLYSSLGEGAGEDD